VTSRPHVGPAVIDTTVFGSALTPTTAALAAQYDRLVAGCVPFISFVTVAELRFGAHHAGWGSARLQKLETRLATAEIVWSGPSLVESYVKLPHDCAAIGHGLGHKDHEADRWIAATALWLRVPLVAHDTIFKDVPGLNLITTLS
jgi:tRNA(fMet)-specific endonuclease VapC